MAASERGTASGQLHSGHCVITGWNAHETAGAAAEFELYDGTSTSGNKFAAVNMAADEAAGFSFGPDGLVCPAGVYLNVVSGAVEVFVYVR